MKKVLLALAVFLCISYASNAQTTYYWIGGSGTQTTTGATAISWSAASWNTAQDGSGSQRTASAGNDILIFDGNAAGLVSKTIYIKDMPVRDSAGQLKLINGVTVSVLTLAPVTANTGTVSFGATYGGCVTPVTGTGTDFTTSLKKGDYIYTTGYTNMVEVLNVSSATDLTAAAEPSVAQVGTTYYRANAFYIKGNPGLSIDATSSLGFGITLASSSQLGAFVLALQPGATGIVNGNLNFLSRGNGAKLVAQDAGSLVFASGSNCNFSMSGGKFYMLGNTCGTGSASAATFAFNTSSPAIVFQAGSNFRHNNVQGQTPFGVSYAATAPLTYSPAVSFLPNSNYYFLYTNGYQPYFFSNGATFGNLIWSSTATPGAASTTTFYLNPARIDTLQILAMGSPASPINAGRIILYGDYINSSTTTCNFGTMLFAGTSLQKISGTNTTSTIGNLVINDNANVQLAKNITVVTSASVLGKLDVGTYTITGTGATFTNNNALNKTYDKPTGSLLPGGVTAASGSKTITVNGISTILIGSTVTSVSHPSIFAANTFVTGYSGSGVYTLSTAATVSADSASTPTLSLTFTSTAGTVITPNAGGLNGSLPSFTTYNFNNATNYVFNGTFAQVTGALLPATLNNLTTSNTIGVSLSGAVTVNGALAISAGTLTTGSNNLTLGTTSASNIIGSTGVLSITGGTTDFGGKSITIQSASSSTGTIAAITGDNLTTGLIGATNVTVQRYIPSGNRAYRFLTPSVTTTTFIKANWQEGTNNPNTSTNNNPVANFGTHITGSTSGTNGFDATLTGNASLYQFDNTAITPTWVNITNTDATTLKAGNAYRILIRGNRAVDLTAAASPTSTATTLRATGTLVTGTVVMNSTGSGATVGMPLLSGTLNGYSLLGNPYASPIVWDSVYTNASGVEDYYYTWDPTRSTRGAYVYWDRSDNNNNLPGSAVNQHIQPGQAIFVKNTSISTAPALIFKETYKSSTFTNVFRTQANLTGKLTIGLTNAALIASNNGFDGANILFADNFLAGIDGEDIPKITNQDENLSIFSNATNLMKESRPTVTLNDTVQLKVWQLASNSYILTFDAQQFASNKKAYLLDGYLNTSSPINITGSTQYPFTTNAAVASYDAKRFAIVFKASGALPVSITALKAYQKNTGVQVEWNTINETNMNAYEVEKSTDAINFSKAGTVAATGNSSYNWFDASPVNGNNYYRIKLVDKNGTSKFTQVVNVKIGGIKNSFTVVGNPVKNKTIILQMENVEKGSYTVTVFNNLGQAIATKAINHNGGSATESIALGNAAVGTYQLSIIGSNVKEARKIIVE